MQLYICMLTSQLATCCVNTDNQASQVNTLTTSDDITDMPNTKY